MKILIKILKIILGIMLVSPLVGIVGLLFFKFTIPFLNRYGLWVVSLILLR